jgi:hypothetical protein
MNNPKKRRSLIAPVAGLALAISGLAAQAQPITGTISFVGGADLDGSLTSASNYTGFFQAGGGPSPVVLGGSQTGSYATVANGTQVTFFTFSFLPFTGPQTLWSFTSGATTYSFTATSLLTDTMHAGFLNLAGDGIAHITGLADTTATWSYTDTGSGAGPAFSFGGSIAVTPEPSTAALVTTLGLLGYGVRFIARRKSLPRSVS